MFPINALFPDRSSHIELQKVDVKMIVQGMIDETSFTYRRAARKVLSFAL